MSWTKPEDEWKACFYCDTPLIEGRYEQDHFPLPARYDGIATVPACHQCHDLKDRIMIGNWRIEHVMEGWREMGRFGRLLLAKTVLLALDKMNDDEREKLLSNA